MKKILATLILLSLLSNGCAKMVQVNYMQEAGVAIKAITESDIPADQKPNSIRDVLANTVTLQAQEMARKENRGSNTVQIVMGFFGILASIGTAIGVLK